MSATKVYAPCQIAAYPDAIAGWGVIVRDVADDAWRIYLAALDQDTARRVSGAMNLAEESG